MLSRCNLGFHKWNDSCTCKICGAKRDDHHNWNGCTCTVCGEKRDEEHDWDECVCRICNKKREASAPEHDWDGCICKKCGLVLWSGSDKHDWNGCTCKKCGTVRKEGHELDGCVCTICGEEVHDWEHIVEEYADTEQFEACGGGLENMWMMHQPGDSFWRCRRCGEEQC